MENARKGALQKFRAEIQEAVKTAPEKRTPYQWQHGDEDTVVPLLMDELLELALDRSPAPHEGHVLHGKDHDIAQDAEVLERVRAWYAAHGLF